MTKSRNNAKRRRLVEDSGQEASAAPQMVDNIAASVARPQIPNKRRQRALKKQAIKQCMQPLETRMQDLETRNRALEAQDEALQTRMHDLEMQNCKLHELNATFESRVRALESTVGHCAVHGQYLRSRESTPSAGYGRAHENGSQGAGAVDIETQMTEENEEGDGCSTDVLVFKGIGRTVLQDAMVVEVKEEDRDDDRANDGNDDVVSEEPHDSESSDESVEDYVKIEENEDEAVDAGADEAAYVIAF